MKKNIQGPCLSHCYKDEKLLYLVVGFILGIIAYAMVERILVKPKDNQERKDLFPSSS